jgi:hypothetical protein
VLRNVRLVLLERPQVLAQPLVVYVILDIINQLLVVVHVSHVHLELFQQLLVQHSVPNAQVVSFLLRQLHQYVIVV